jgi:hypothetical protein
MLIETPMKVPAFCLIGILFGATALADSLSPSAVVKWAFQAARGDKLRQFLALVDVASIQAQKEQARSPEETVRLLAAINPKELKLDDPQGTGQPGSRVEVSLTVPIRLKFVVLCVGRPAGEPVYKIVELYRIEQGSK